MFLQVRDSFSHPGHPFCRGRPVQPGEAYREGAKLPHPHVERHIDVHNLFLPLQPEVGLLHKFISRPQPFFFNFSAPKMMTNRAGHL